MEGGARSLVFPIDWVACAVVPCMGCFLDPRLPAEWLGIMRKAVAIGKQLTSGFVSTACNPNRSLATILWTVRAEVLHIWRVKSHDLLWFCILPANRLLNLFAHLLSNLLCNCFSHMPFTLQRPVGSNVVVLRHVATDGIRVLHLGNLGSCTQVIGVFLLESDMWEFHA